MQSNGRVCLDALCDERNGTRKTTRIEGREEMDAIVPAYVDQ
jgi:hypothetical protein